LEDELRAGVWKVPIYKPPANVSVNISNFANEMVRIPNTMVWLRLDYPDEPQTVKCHPSYAHIYTIPPIHNVIVREEADTPERPGYDPSFKNRGFQIYVHYATGYFPTRKVRVAVCLQYKKDIINDEDELLCFYATSGRNPNTLIMEGIEDKTSMGDVILWNENTTWVRDYYKYLWDIWDREAKRNLNLVVQFLELKEGILPSQTKSITRELVESEYDLIGYGIIRLNDEFGKFLFGTFTVDLYDGPIYVEELLDNKRNGYKLKVTVQQPGEIVHPMPAPKPTKEIPAELRKQMDSKKVLLFFG
jgi:hypothetical protein